MDKVGGRRPDGMTGGREPGRSGLPVDPYRLKRALLRDSKWLVGAGIVGIIVGFLWVKLMMASGYQTIVVLKYEGEHDLPGVLASKRALGPSADALMHQDVLRKIREEIGLEDSLTSLAGMIDYHPNFQEGTLEFAVGGRTGEDAAEFARVVTEVFMTFHKERQARRIEDEIARTRKRIEAAEDEAEEARQRYNAFREEHEIANLSTEQGSMIESAARLRADSELEMAEIRALEAEVRSLETQLASTPKTSFISDNSSPERSEYNRRRRELASARATLSADHPRVQALEQQVNQMRSQLRSGGGVSSSVDGVVAVNATYQAVEARLRDARANLEALRERQKGLSAMADKAQHRVEAFSDIEGEASALLAEVNVDENLVGVLRRTEAVLGDALRDPPSGFVVLDPGHEPEYPVPNKMKKVIFVAIPMLTVSLMLLVVLWREFRGLLLETPAEVAFWGNGPTLGATSWPNDPRGLDELVAGLDDFVPKFRGSLLIVGASPAESPLAGQLARRVKNDWFLAPGHVTATRTTPEPARHEPAPLQTPPPSGPYPVGRSGGQSTALARLPSLPPVEPVRLTRSVDHFQLEAWDGPYEGQALRRAARLADRIVALVRSGAISAGRLQEIQSRLGRQDGIGYIVVGLPDELRTLHDRAGDVAAFWKS